MNRFHVHVAVDDLKQSIAFYSALGLQARGSSPSNRKEVQLLSSTSAQPNVRTQSASAGM
jgi:catechol 2,3-dioxygenase-like lactoylglutathione lyase family enzyme